MVLLKVGGWCRRPKTEKERGSGEFGLVKAVDEDMASSVDGIRLSLLLYFEDSSYFTPALWVYGIYWGVL